MVFHLYNGVRTSRVEMICEMDFVRYPQFPFNYESEPGYIKNYNSYPYDSSSFPQQELCCEACGDLFEADHCQPSQYTVNHPIFNAHNDLLNANNYLLNSQNKITISQNKLMEQLTSMCAMVGQLIQKKQEEKQIKKEQAANARYWKIPACCDDDDDFVITPDELVDSLSMGDEHLNTISATESDEFIKSCVENLVPNPNQNHDNTEFTHDSSLIISSKIDSLLDEFADELTLLKSIPSGIDKTDCYPEKEIRLTKRLLYDNSSACPSEEFVSENSNANIESFSPSHIPIKDSDSLMEEIDLSFNLDDPMPSGIEEDDDDFERDILIREELLDKYSLPVTESYHFDILSFSRPPEKPPDEHSYFGCSSFLFLSPLIKSSMEELGQAQRPKTNASWEAPHAYQ
nr:hypothetical protein [Tanacetum cinerariifolium]